MRTVVISSILALLFMLFSSHLDEHDLLYIFHSHQTTSHSHQEHHKTQSQVVTSLSVKRMSVASHHKTFLSQVMISAGYKSSSTYVTDRRTALFASIHSITINQFKRLRI